MIPYTMKIDTLYMACSPELDVVSYGACQDEAINNLSDEIRVRGQQHRATGDERKSV